VTQTYSVPNTYAAGAYSVIVKADAYNYVAESSETDNTAALAITLPERPNLVLSSLSLTGAVTINQNGTYNVPVSYTVTNTGTSTAKAEWYDFGYISTDGVLDASDVNIGNTYRSTDLAPGASYTVTQTYSVPNTYAAGAYSVIVKADAYNYVAESSETDNTAVVAITLP
jgi:subtilase family serine protease